MSSSIVDLGPTHLTVQVPRNTDAVFDLKFTDRATGALVDLTGDTITWITKASRAAALPLWEVVATLPSLGVARFDFTSASHLNVANLTKDTTYVFEVTRLHNADLTQVAIGELVLTERYKA